MPEINLLQVALATKDRNASFRRAGRTFTMEPTILNMADLEPGQFDALVNEPRLTVSHVTASGKVHPLTVGDLDDAPDAPAPSDDVSEPAPASELPLGDAATDDAPPADETDDTPLPVSTEPPAAEQPAPVAKKAKTVKKTKFK